jgi:hypothetical protein
MLSWCLAFVVLIVDTLSLSVLFQCIISFRCPRKASNFTSERLCYEPNGLSSSFMWYGLALPPFPPTLPSDILTNHFPRALLGLFTPLDVTPPSFVACKPRRGLVATLT